MSYELEAKLIGALLRRGGRFWDLPANFSAAAFHRDECRKAFEGLARLAARKSLPDGEMDFHILEAEAGLDETERSAVHFCRSWADKNTDAKELARMLLNEHRREELAAIFASAAERVKTAEPADLAADVLGRLLAIDRAERPDTRSWKDATLSFLDELEAQQGGKSGAVVKTGFADLDRLLHIRPGNVVVLGARPKVGKTTLARQIARYVAGQNRHVLMHSLEMTATELVALDVSAAAGMDTERFYDGSTWGTAEWDAVHAGVDKLIGPTEGRLHTNDGYSGLGAIARITERMHRKHGLGLVVLDYLQLVGAEAGKQASRENQVSLVSRTVKELAQRLGVPWLVLSQLNRDPAKRGEPTKARGAREPEDNRSPPPQLHDLRESGAIEQDANAVLLLHNPTPGVPGPFDLIVAAQRLGRTGAVRLTPDLRHSRFHSHRPTPSYSGSYVPGDGE